MLNKYIVKEYGSWGVMILSFLSGLVAARGYDTGTAVSFIALALYINSKQSFTLWVRGRRSSRILPLFIFMVQMACATALLVFAAGKSISALAPYAVIPLLYLLLLKFLGEHDLLTEISGFLLLSMSSLIAKFTILGEIDQRLFLAVAVFFIAGVFKVRLQFQKKFFYRMLMIVYTLLAVLMYHAAKIPGLLLLPLADNVLFAMILYNTKVRTTGWLEVFKGLLFVMLTALYYV